MKIAMNSAVWILNFIYADMSKFADQLGELGDYELEPLAGDVSYVGNVKYAYVQQIVHHMTHTTRCMLNYAYVNAIDIKNLVEGDEAYEQAKATWDLINSNCIPDEQQDPHVVQRYCDRSYTYCIALWNSAQQILINEKDVYNEKFGDFIVGMEKLSNGELSFGDERTHPLFMLIAQLDSFRIE